jgi:hypothetical protein
VVARRLPPPPVEVCAGTQHKTITHRQASGVGTTRVEGQSQGSAWWMRQDYTL